MLKNPTNFTDSKIDAAVQKLSHNPEIEKHFDKIFNDILYVIRDGFKNCLGCPGSLWITRVKSNHNFRDAVFNSSCANIVLQILDSISKNSAGLFWTKPFVEEKFHADFLKVYQEISYNLLKKPVVDAFIVSSRENSILPWDDSVLLEKFLYVNFSVDVN